MYEPKTTFEQLVISKLESIEKINLRQNHSLAEHENRIRGVEIGQGKLFAGVSIIGAIFGIIGSLIGKLINLIK